MGHRQIAQGGRRANGQARAENAGQIERGETSRALETVIGAPRDVQVRVEETGIREERHRIDAEQRRKPRHAAAGADEQVRARDDLRLESEVAARPHDAPQAQHAPAVGERVVFVLVERDAGVELDDRERFAQCRQHGAEMSANIGAI